MGSGGDVAGWFDAGTVRVDMDRCEIADEDWLREMLAGVRVVFLGETNHFVHEKVEFRLCWIRALAAQRKLLLAEEIGWSDGRRIADYILGANDAALARAATFGYRGHLRADRDDSPKGVFADSGYPYGSMLAEHGRFYRALRETGRIRDYIGFDIDSPGGGYEDIASSRDAMADRVPDSFWRRLERVTDESLLDEAARLEALLPLLAEPALAQQRQDLLSLVESLRYTGMIRFAEDYEAVRPAMVYREETMKRRIRQCLARLPGDTTLVLMSHAFHLAKDDSDIERKGVGPGGDRVSSLGHYIVNELGESVRSVWMLYGGGEDAQPLPDLPQRANYPRDSINRQLAARFASPVVLPITPGVRGGLSSVRVGHMYDTVVDVNLGLEADAVMFFPEVTPLRQFW